MNDGNCLLRTIWENPADDTARLVYADWLQEQGREVEAEFISSHVEGGHRDQESYLGPGDILMYKDRSVAKGDSRLRGAGVYPDGKLWWRRGFCYRLDCHSESLQWVPYICRDHPIEEVRLINKRPAAGSGHGDWVWEPGFSFDRSDQIPFFIAEAGGWKAIMQDGLMLYSFDGYAKALLELWTATATWGRKAGCGH